MKIKILACIALLLTLIACEKPEKESGELHTLVIDGSSTVFPLTQSVIKKFNKEKPSEIYFYHSSSGSNIGFEKFSTGELNFINASRKITKEESDLLESKNVELIEMKIAYDGICFILNEENDWVDYLTTDELKSIWSESGHRRWKDVRSEWPNEFILLYGPGKESGTLDFFKNTILNETELRESYIFSQNDDILVDGVSDDKYSLGFLGLSYYQNNKENVRIVPIDNGNGPIAPSPESIGEGKDYAFLSRPLYIYFNASLLKTKKGKLFIEFYLNNVGKAATEVGYIPLETDEYEKLRELYLSSK